MILCENYAGMATESIYDGFGFLVDLIGRDATVFDTLGLWLGGGDDVSV